MSALMISAIMLYEKRNWECVSVYVTYIFKSWLHVSRGFVTVFDYLYELRMIFAYFGVNTHRGGGSWSGYHPWT